MNILEDFVSTILGQKEDNYNENLAESYENLANDSTILGHDDKNLQCEKQIIQCQVTNDRLLGSTSKSLRKKYGDEIVDRTIRRLAQRRKRDKCSRKAMINEIAIKFKPVIDHYFKKKDESFSSSAL